MFGDVSGIFWGMFGVDFGGILEDFWKVFRGKFGENYRKQKLINKIN